MFIYKNEFLNLINENYKTFNWHKITDEVYNCEAYECNFSNGLSLILNSACQHIELHVYIGKECKSYHEYDFPVIRNMFDYVYNNYENTKSNKFFLEAIKRYNNSKNNKYGK